jgi:hypothetical protein
MATIVVAIFIDALLCCNLSKQGFDVLVATFAGLVVLAVISRLSFKMLLKPLGKLGDLWGDACCLWCLLCFVM